MTCQDCAKPIGARSKYPLCKNCYNRRRHAGTLPEKAPTKALRPVVPCVRCSLSTVSPIRLCGDCQLVVADLREMDRWAS